MICMPGRSARLVGADLLGGAPGDQVSYVCGPHRLTCLCDSRAKGDRIVLDP
ncbi:MAG: hypothetical protein HC807_02305 [Gammaproteobacteria bacterium]|nr:hypothetical protein [Gammaproteobacteria bacterium]